MQTRGFLATITTVSRASFMSGSVLSRSLPLYTACASPCGVLPPYLFPCPVPWSSLVELLFSLAFQFVTNLDDPLLGPFMNWACLPFDFPSVVSLFLGNVRPILLVLAILCRFQSAQMYPRPKQSPLQKHASGQTRSWSFITSEWIRSCAPQNMSMDICDMHVWRPASRRSWQCCIPDDYCQLHKSRSVRAY